MCLKYQIEKLGPSKIASPMHLGTQPGDTLADFMPDDSRIVADVHLEAVLKKLKAGEELDSMEQAGPREKIYFDPSKLKVGIVTCGGICPGLNEIIRGLVMTLYYGYGVRGILGFKYGYAGLNPKFSYPTMDLDPEIVRNINVSGGSILGTSRGPQPPEVMVDTLERMNIRLLFTIGGDGTFRGAMALYEEIEKRELKIAVVGIPKTIDNDIALVDKTFGFDTAVGLAASACQAAYSESKSVENGIGLVKLMGRHSGFIAANAALSMRNVNLVLIPELDFELEGPNGLFAYLKGRFQKQKSTVIIVAEGAGQEHLAATFGNDDSGNLRLGDIGVFLKDKITERFRGEYNFSVKYIDPSYMIRSAPACTTDSIFCGYLAQCAAHAGMTGRTGMAVGRSHGKFTHLPLSALVSHRKKVDPESNMWLSVLESTGQPFYLTNEVPKKLAQKSFYQG